MAERERAALPRQRATGMSGAGAVDRVDDAERSTEADVVVVLSADEVRRALTRVAHEIVERNRGTADLTLIGLQTGGVWVADRLAEQLERIDGLPVPVGLLDATFERDDFGLRPLASAAPTVIDHDLTGRTVVLCDDVLFTGRTVRAALNALNRYGRARAVQLAVVVDRGHRELPIRPDFVGKNLGTRRDEVVEATADGVRIVHGAGE